MSNDLDSLTQRAAEEVVQQADLDRVVDVGEDDALLDREAAVLPLHLDDEEAA